MLPAPPAAQEAGAFPLPRVVLSALRMQQARKDCQELAPGRDFRINIPL